MSQSKSSFDELIEYINSTLPPAFSAPREQIREILKIHITRPLKEILTADEIELYVDCLYFKHKYHSYFVSVARAIEIYTTKRELCYDPKNCGELDMAQETVEIYDFIIYNWDKLYTEFSFQS